MREGQGGARGWGRRAERRENHSSLWNIEAPTTCVRVKYNTCHCRWVADTTADCYSTLSCPTHECDNRAVNELT